MPRCVIDIQYDAPRHVCQVFLPFFLNAFNFILIITDFGKNYSAERQAAKAIFIKR